MNGMNSPRSLPSPCSPLNEPLYFLTSVAISCKMVPEQVPEGSGVGRSNGMQDGSGPGSGAGCSNCLQDGSGMVPDQVPEQGVAKHSRMLPEQGVAEASSRFPKQGVTKGCGEGF